jgi:hypothetical protein
MIKRVSALTVAVVLGVSGFSASAFGATKPSTLKWTAARCTAWKVAALKRDHNKPTAKQIASANKTFARHGCKIRL